MMLRFRDKSSADKIINRLAQMKLDMTLMHVCGTHQDTIIRYGLDNMLEEVGIDIKQGPGCPVCVTTTAEIELARTLAKKGKIVATYGDMLRVPAASGSLQDARSEGAKVRIVYSITDAVKLAKQTADEVVFVAIGFETTAPSTAITVLSNPPSNFSVLSCHRYLPPALEALLSMGELKIQGIIEPGHVSAIIGTKPYQKISEKYRLPQVVAGFEPLDVLMAVYMIARQILSSKHVVENEYRRTVREEGNKRALEVLSIVFEPKESKWRGFPTIPDSKMQLKDDFDSFDAEKKHADDLREVSGVQFPEPEGCGCDRVLRGLMDPQECLLFGKACTPSSPIGPCMVSMEGSCTIEFKYRRTNR